MLSFNFNKKKEQGVKRVQVGEKVMIEGMVQGLSYADRCNKGVIIYQLIFLQIKK